MQEKKSDDLILNTQYMDNLEDWQILDLQADLERDIANIELQLSKKGGTDDWRAGAEYAVKMKRVNVHFIERYSDRLMHDGGGEEYLFTTAFLRVSAERLDNETYSELVDETRLQINEGLGYE